MRAISARLLWTGASLERDQALLVDRDRVAGTCSRDRVPEGYAVEEWGNVALLPGTVNAHGHSFQSLLKGFGDDRSFESWRDEVLYPFSETLSAEAIYTGALFAFAEALRAGATTAVDFFYLHDGGNDNAHQVVRAAHDIGMRLVLARAFYDHDASTAAPARYREDAVEAAGRCTDLAAEYAGDPLVSVQPAPHSLHAAAPATIAIALELAGELDCPCHLHLAEARYERAQVERRYGVSPVRLLAREGLLDGRLLLVHCVWIDEEEMDLIAGVGASVVHCPGANAFLGDGIAPTPELLRRGVRVALGPDGGCANNRQSVFEEMRTASLMAKARLLDGGALDAATALDLGTRAGGDVLGLPVGTFEKGAYADAVALDLDDLSLQPLATVGKQLVHSLQPTAIARVMVGGDIVVEKGRLTRVEESALLDRIAAATAGWSRPRAGRG